MSENSEFGPGELVQLRDVETVIRITKEGFVTRMKQFFDKFATLLPDDQRAVAITEGAWDLLVENLETSTFQLNWRRVPAGHLELPR